MRRNQLPIVPFRTPALLLLLSSFVCALMLLSRLAAPASSPSPIHFTASILPSPIHPGEAATVRVSASLDPGWHVYSAVPTPGGPGTTALTAAGDWQPLGATSEDAATLTRMVDPNFGLLVRFHENHSVFTRAFRVPAGTASAQSTPLSVTIHYQTCNDKICLPPTDASVPVSAAITAGPVRPQYAEAATVASTIPTAASESATRPIRAQDPPLSHPAGSGFGLFLLTALGAGLLAIVTPCVFPLIPITLTSFVKQSNGDRARLVRLSCGYALGIVALYVLVGAVVAATLHGQANTIAANPWVNLTEFLLFVVFAFSFFEVVELRLPGNLWKLQQAARGQSGMAGLALLGVSFVLGSFTCTAPFVGTLLVNAAGGQWSRPLLGMLTFALAFASPFFVFAAFPQWIHRIPKGGLWLSRFKATLGFIELAAALKFLSNADQVWQWKLITQPVLLAAWAVVFFAAAMYLAGTLRFGIVAAIETEEERHHFPVSRRITSAAFAIAGVYCFWGLAGRPISPYVGAFLPAPAYGGAAEAAELDTLPWLPSYAAALAEAKAQNKLLLIDFTGYTCTNCRLNEKKVFPQPQVQAALAPFVRVQLYTDGQTAEDKANARLQQAKLGDVALPLYGILDAQSGAVVATTEGVQSAGGFEQFLALGKGQSRAASPAPPACSPYSAAAVQQSGSAGRPAIVDFTASWCVNCKAIEHDVFENPAVASQLAQQFTTLRSDMTEWSAPASTVLQKQYGIASLPSIIFIGKDGKEIKSLRITGRISVLDFQKRMHLAMS